MKEKFIEDTDERYSITEDGRVFSNYRLVCSHGKYYKKPEHKEQTVYKDNTVALNHVRVSLRKLQFENLGYMFCKKCKNRIYSYRYHGICKDCVKRKYNEWRSEYNKKNLEKLRVYSKTYKDKNPEKYAQICKNNNTENRKNLTKSYVASSMNISIKDLSEELYEHHKNLILFKRELIEKHGISIQKLNKTI